MASEMPTRWCSRPINSRLETNTGALELVPGAWGLGSQARKSLSLSRSTQRGIALVNGWWEIEIHCESALEESILWRLEQFGCRGSASTHDGRHYRIKSYIPEGEVHLLDLGALAIGCKQDALTMALALPRVSWQRLEEEDWATGWKSHWKPEEIGDRFLVCPAWLEPPPSDRLVITLDPGSAFGTGAHQTTQLCLESLEMRIGGYGDQAPPPIIADIGCGSGILSIGAIKLGADRVYGVDTDSLAVIATAKNRDLNQLSDRQISVEMGSIEQIKTLADAGIEFDGIVCNILAEIITQLIPTMTEVANPKTWAILSGILNTQASEIAALLEQHGWIVATLWKRDEWCCFNVRRS